MMQHDGQHVVELLDVAQDLVADLGVGLDVFVFGLGQLARLAEHVVVDADLADVVQQAGEVDRVQGPAIAAQLFRQANRDAGHAIAMTAGVGILGVDGRGQRPHDAPAKISAVAGTTRRCRCGCPGSWRRSELSKLASTVPNSTSLLVTSPEPVWLNASSQPKR